MRMAVQNRDRRRKGAPSNSVCFQKALRPSGPGQKVIEHLTGRRFSSGTRSVYILPGCLRADRAKGSQAIWPQCVREG
jgi:hypothetical protein